MIKKYIASCGNLAMTAIILGTLIGVMNTVNDATQQLQQRYIKNRFSSSVEEWPPYQPKQYTTLAFIHNKGKHTDAVRFSVTQQLAVAGKINPPEFPKHSDLNVSMTKNISDIFLPIVHSDGSSVDLYILIEGAPGIGKTVLAKEIAYQWANNELLRSNKLLLLVFLRECHQTQFKSVENLLQFVFKNDIMIPCLTIHILQTEGSDTVVVFDGYDELPEEIKKNSIIADIINRRILTKCCLVVTSRPTASACLHGNVDRRVEVVGFTEEDRLDYIQSAFKNCDKKVKALQHYLQSNPTINALCYIPLNMTILLCLAEDGIDTLPKTQTELYKNFTQMTIVRFIKKYENHNTIIKIANLPKLYRKVFIELAKLAFKALETDKIVFTLSEIEQGCPNLTMNPSNWNGLGLLKAVQYFSQKMGNDQVTFHFLHFSVQEYMAAWYISTLSDNKQIKLLEKTFWEHRYYNTWIMYVGITGGSSFALKHFLSPYRFQFYSRLFKPTKISNKYLKHKMKCLHLFQCLVEADKEDDIKSVKQLFQSNQIDLSNQTLLPSDLNTLGFFLIRSINKEWDELDLSYCNIGLNGSNILCDRLSDKDVRSIVTIKRVDFSHNQLNSSSLIRLLGLFKSWSTLEIIITDDAVLDSTSSIQEIEDIVLQSSTLTIAFIGCFLFSKSLKLGKILANTRSIKSIYLLNCNWKSGDSKILELLENQKLDKVRIIGSSLDTTMIQAIALMLICKNRFVNMLIYDPTLSDESGDYISNLILGQNKGNSGVMLLVSVNKIQGFINTCTLSNELSTLELYNLNEYVRYLKTKMRMCPWRQDIQSSGKNINHNAFVEAILNNYNWHLQVSLLEDDTIVVHKTDFSKLVNAINSLSNVNLQNVATLMKLYISGSHITDQTADDIASVISCNIHLKELNLGYNILQPLCILKITRSLLKVSSLTKLYINHNNITYEAAGDIATVVSCNLNLQEFDISGNNLQTAGIIKVMKALKGINTLRKLYISNSNVTDEVADDIATVISCNPDLEVLDISGNTLQSKGAIKIGNFLQNIYTPKTLFVTNTDNTTDVDISAVISDSASLQEIYICRNDLQTTDAKIFTKSLQAICTLSKIHIGYNNISDEVANDIASCISCNEKLKETEISRNEIQTTGTIKIMKGLQEINALKILFLDNNNIPKEAADDIAAVISCNIYLQELNLGGNDLQGSGIMKIAKSLQNISSLTKLCIDHNNITDESAVNIAAVILCNINLQEFDISGNNLQTTGITKIMKALKVINTLRKLNISNNDITDEAADDIAAVISCNTDLKVLDVNGNSLRAKGAIKIGNFLQNIYTPKTLFITNNIDDNIDGADVDISAVISDSASLQEIYICRNDLQTTDAKIFTKLLQAICTLSKIHIGYNNISDEVANDIASCISCNEKLKETEISRNEIQTTGAIKIMKGLQEINALKILFLDNNNIPKEAADDIAAVISCNIYLQELNLGGNDLQGSGIMKIAKNLQNISSLTKLYIDHNDITDAAADDIAAVISCNMNLQELNLGGNHLQASGIMKIAKSLQNISSLTKLYIDHNDITDAAADDIAAVISCNMNLQELNLGGNHLQSSGTAIIAVSLQKISSLTKFCIDHNNITDESAVNIAAVISCNINLQEFDISGNNLQTTGITKIMKALKVINTLKKLNISNNDITDEAADDIAAVISCNTDLKVLDVSGNSLQAKGAIKIGNFLQNIYTPKTLFITNNIDGADVDISTVISDSASLQEIYICRNDLQTTDAKIFTKSLQAICTLSKLHIGYNNISDEVANDIAIIVSCNSKLNEIEVSRNKMQTTGAIKILKGLQVINAVKKNLSQQ